jgi:pimeloyl-ACP methyl ester carboxylesterase
MRDGKIQAADGRLIGFADFGSQEHTPVLWCHGGPGSRLEPEFYAAQASAAELRLVGIDRPGYGLSDPNPGRSIGDWSGDALAVADSLNLDRFLVTGVSTGGGYALALAAAAPDRIPGVVVCCGMTDMRWGVEHAMMPANQRIWRCTERSDAQAVAIEDFGEDGARMLEGDDVADMLAPADLRLLEDPDYVARLSSGESFTQGVVGYADDRLADAPRHGWSSFDPAEVRCPVTIIHGEADGIVPVAHALHTAQLVPHSKLRLFPEGGHLSVIREVVPVLKELRSLL